MSSATFYFLLIWLVRRYLGREGLGMRLFDAFTEFCMVPRLEEIQVASNYTRVPMSCSGVTGEMLTGRQDV